jgi:hypothetical protein
MTPTPLIDMTAPAAAPPPPVDDLGSEPIDTMVSLPARHLLTLLVAGGMVSSIVGVLADGEALSATGLAVELDAAGLIDAVPPDDAADGPVVADISDAFAEALAAAAEAVQHLIPAECLPEETAAVAAE